MHGKNVEKTLTRYLKGTCRKGERKAKHCKMMRDFRL